MKYFVSLFLFFALNCFAGDYSDAPKYPSTTATSGTFTITKGGVMQEASYSAPYTAFAAAIALSQKCTCDVVINQPSITIKTVYKNNAVSSSSKSSSSSIISSSSKTASSSSIVSSSAFSIKIEGENFITGKGIQTEPTTDIGGGLDAGYWDSGNWGTYKAINIPVAGKYKITYRVAANYVGAGFKLTNDETDEIYDNVSVDVTGGWQNWVDLEKEIELPAGNISFKFISVGDGWNINWFKIESAEAVDNSSSSASSSSIAPIVSGKTATLTMSRPNKRVDGSVLTAGEISGYSIRKISLDSKIIYLTIAPQQTDPIVYVLPWDVLDSDIIQVAAIDYNGLYSDFVDVVR